MKILLPIKRVVDYHVAVQASRDGSGVDTEHAKKSMNPFDAIAVEEAIRIKEKHPDTELITISIGPLSCQETLRQALSMGADRAILVETNRPLEPLNIAKILRHYCQQENPSLVICGKQAIDDDCNQTGQMLAALMDWPQGCFISKLQLEDNNVIIEREVDDGLEILQLTLPCILTTDLRLNEPRFAKLPNIVKAKKKPLEKTSINELPIEIQTHHEHIHFEAPASRPPGRQLESVDELIDALKQHEVLT